MHFASFWFRTEDWLGVFCSLPKLKFSLHGVKIETKIFSEGMFNIKRAKEILVFFPFLQSSYVSARITAVIYTSHFWTLRDYSSFYFFLEDHSRLSLVAFWLWKKIGLKTFLKIGIFEKNTETGKSLQFVLLTVKKTWKTLWDRLK
jgi:hypothetical protein